MIKKILIIILSYVTIIITGIIDYFIGHEISFSVFYLISIFIVSWKFGLIHNIIICIFAAVVWFISDLLSSHQYSHFIIPYWNTLIRLAFFIIISSLLYLCKKHIEKINTLANLDGLTKLYNNRFFYELLDLEFKKAKRYQYHFSIIYIDLDNFKQVNDTYGHNKGDELLIDIANILKNSVRESDIIARVGGDEFVIFLQNINAEYSLMIINKLKTEIINEMKKNNWPVTCSIGIATYYKIPDKMHEIIKNADNLMYIAKKKGKNRIKQEIYK